MSLINQRLYLPVVAFHDIMFVVLGDLFTFVENLALNFKILNFTSDVNTFRPSGNVAVKQSPTLLEIKEVR